jgi:hypothetical protein
VVVPYAQRPLPGELAAVFSGLRVQVDRDRCGSTPSASRNWRTPSHHLTVRVEPTQIHIRLPVGRGETSPSSPNPGARSTDQPTSRYGLRTIDQPTLDTVEGVFGLWRWHSPPQAGRPSGSPNLRARKRTVHWVTVWTAAVTTRTRRRPFRGTCGLSSASRGVARRAINAADSPRLRQPRPQHHRRSGEPPDVGRVHAHLIEYYSRDVAAARDRVAAGPVNVAVTCVYAVDFATYAPAVPADLVLLVGCWATSMTTTCAGRSGRWCNCALPAPSRHLDPQPPRTRLDATLPGGLGASDNLPDRRELLWPGGVWDHDEPGATRPRDASRRLASDSWRMDPPGSSSLSAADSSSDGHEPAHYTMIGIPGADQPATPKTW